MNSNTDTTIQVDEVTPKDDLFETSIPEYGEYCSIKEKICNFGSVPILYGLYEAYCHHRPIKFSPDDFWLLIIQNFILRQYSVNVLIAIILL